MARYAFRLRLKPHAIEEYERAHAHVWPGLLAKIKAVAGSADRRFCGPRLLKGSHAHRGVF
jgi:hypothetical protein